MYLDNCTFCQTSMMIIVFSPVLPATTNLIRIGSHSLLSIRRRSIKNGLELCLRVTMRLCDQIELHSNNAMVTIMVITWTTTNIIIEIIILFIKRHGDCGVPSRAAAIHHRSTAIISSLAHSNAISPVEKCFPIIHTNTFYPLEKYIKPFG